MLPKKLLQMIAVISFSVTLAFGQQFSEPVLITSAGQSADILMSKVLAKKAGLEFTMDKLAQPEDVKDYKSILFVCGGSSKGLGAAKIDKDQEYKRVEKVIEAAEDKDIPILLLHLGGKSRRGELSDYFNTLVSKHADYMIVVEGGNEDGFFSKMAEKQKTELKVSEKIIFIKDQLTQLYGKNE